jgi:hypothetical protein
MIHEAHFWSSKAHQAVSVTCDDGLIVIVWIWPAADPCATMPSAKSGSAK